MGSLLNWAQFKAELDHPRDRVWVAKASPTNPAGRPRDCWTSAPLGGTAPTTAVAPTKTGQVGAFPFTDWQNSGGALQNYIVGGNLGSISPGVWLLCDRLSHQGGLSGVVTGAQATNLPTAALTRYTDGEGVMLGLSIYSQVGTTATTVTASYTNQAGTAGQTTPAVVFGSTAFREAGRMIMLPLASGDTGVRAVANVNVVATTGTAGAFGVTLFKPLLAFTLWSPDEPLDPIVSGAMHGGFPEILDDAHLFFVNISSSAVADQLNGRLNIAEV